ncbi:hypothetical protein G7D34_003702 [Salmonella enterica]|nr:hypothetical protein [Salmonella enterica]
MSGLKLGKNRDTEKALAAATEIKPARLQLNIHPALHEKFKKVSFNRDESMSDLITDYVIEYLRKHGAVIDQHDREMFLSNPKKWEDLKL